MKPNLKSDVDPRCPGQYGYAESGSNPYDVHLYPNFLEPNDFEQLKKEVKEVPLMKKYSDMFHFFQSKDIGQYPPKDGALKNVTKFMDMMKTTVREHLQERTKIELDEESPFDITVSRYDTYNYLLCHNDHNPDPSKNYRRAMAFIYYLTSGKMESSDGGGLSLYACDKLKQPRHVQQKIYPTPNMLLVFPTSDMSWHSVDEVLSFQHNRLSINGWFNSSKLPPLPMSDANYMEPCPYSFYKPTHLTPVDVLLVEKIINPAYLKETFFDQVLKKFESDQMLKLDNFLNQDIYDAVALDLQTIQRNKRNQILVGPANKRLYSVLENSKLTPISNLVHRFFRSSLFLNLLRRYTGRDFIGLNDDDSDEATKELNKEKANKSLETILSINPATGDDQQVLSGDQFDEDLPRMPEQEEGKPIKIIDEDNSRTIEKLDPETKKLKIESQNMIRLEYRNYQQGSYTIMNDEAYELFESQVVDLMIPFNSKLYNKDDYGGYHSYLDRDKEAPTGEVNETVRILADQNSLNLVARNNNMRFFRYITHHIPFKSKSSFQELNGVYYEKVDLIPRI